MASWKEKNHDSPEYKQMVTDICNLYLSGQLKEPTANLIPWNASMSNQELETSFLNALRKSQQPFNNTKEILYLNN
jgi:hypothetical protein